MANSKKRCKHCKEYSLAIEGFQAPLGWFCSYDHACEFGRGKAKATQEKARKADTRERETKRKAARKAVKDLNRNTLSWQHKQTQKSFNKMRVLEEKLWFARRGIEPECISCGKTGMDWACGHLATVGASGRLRYSRINTKLQCNRYCNMGLSGNISGNSSTRGYKQGIIDRFGDSVGARMLAAIKGSSGVYRWNCEQLEAMRAQFNCRIRMLEKCL